MQTNEFNDVHIHVGFYLVLIHLSCNYKYKTEIQLKHNKHYLEDMLYWQQYITPEIDGNHGALYSAELHCIDPSNRYFSCGKITGNAPNVNLAT